MRCRRSASCAACVKAVYRDGIGFQHTFRYDIKNRVADFYMASLSVSSPCIKGLAKRLYLLGTGTYVTVIWSTNPAPRGHWQNLLGDGNGFYSPTMRR